MCEIYDPQNNFPTYIPKDRASWKALYPVYKARMTTRNYDTWHILYECKYCGAEAIHASGESAPRTCECQKKRGKPSQPVEVKCLMCGKKFQLTTAQANSRNRHYCSNQCKYKYHTTMQPTAEWLALSPRPRNYNLPNVRVRQVDYRTCIDPRY